jgi:hypothetical protein
MSLTLHIATSSIVMLLGTAPAWAQAPSNDSCATPGVALQGTTTWDNTAATTTGFDGSTAFVCMSPNNPDGSLLGQVHQDLFWTFTIPCDGDWQIDTEGSLGNVNTRLNIHAGAGCTATCLQSDGNGGASPPDSSLAVILNAVEGDTYLLQIGSWAAGVGSGPGLLNIGRTGSPCVAIAVTCDPGLPNSTGGSVTLGNSSIGINATDLHIEATNGPPGEFGFVIVAATASSATSVFSGVLCLDSPIGRYLGQTATAQGVPSLDSIGLFNAMGTFECFVSPSLSGTGFDVPSELPLSPAGQFIQPGDTWCFQLWHRDQTGTPPNQLSTANFSNAISVTFGGIPIDPPVVGLTAYRPQSDGYGDPLQRRAIPDGLEVSPGAGIRINGDDDDGDSVADRDDATVPGENDLIELVWTIDTIPAPPGIEYVLRRTNSNLRVWSNVFKGTPVLDTNDVAVLTPTSGMGSLWVENPNGGDSSLILEARTTSNGTVLSSDLVEFYPFTSVVIGLHGEFQFPTDPVFGFNEGISYMTIDLHEDGYDAHMYDEDDVLADGSGAVYDEIVNAIQNRGVTSVAIFGFSHGGGSTYDVSERLNTNQGSLPPFDLVFTAYADAIENDSDIDLEAEVRRPPGTAYHVNYYQSFGIIPPWGGSVPGADFNQNASSTGWGFFVTHITMMTYQNILDGIRLPLLIRTPR